jgi:hypothetical protein
MKDLKNLRKTEPLRGGTKSQRGNPEKMIGWPRRHPGSSP